jgi:hypothetical protein
MKPDIEVRIIRSRHGVAKKGPHLEWAVGSGRFIVGHIQRLFKQNSDKTK